MEKHLRDDTMTHRPADAAVTLITGFPAFTARRMALKVLEACPDEQVVLLAPKDQRSAGELFCASLSPSQKGRVVIMHGDVTSMDLGLSGQEYRTLQRDVTWIHHMAARYHLGAPRELVEQTNVNGTRAVLELSLECERLRRFCFWSTIHVAGDREGVVMEEELDHGQTFRNSYESTKFAAERVVRQMSRRVPCTVLRPGIVVGDSRSGEIGPYDGPYHLMTVLINGPFDLRLPMPGRGDGPLHLVPIDFVIEVAHHLSRLDRAVSKTFHLVDPAPLSARSIFHLVAERAQRRPARVNIPSTIAKAMLKLPLPWVGELKGAPKTIMEGFNQHVIYNARNTLEALRGTEIWCPPIEHYVDNLVRFAKQTRAGTVTGREDSDSLV